MMLLTQPSSYLYKSVVSVFLLLTFVLRAHVFAEKPMNVLFIAVDDMNTDLGCYGIEQVKTPNIDRLAKMGARFDRAYCQQPLCGPSRASMMTGLRPNTTGFVHLNDNLRELKPDVITMGQFFRQRDYYVARIGKIFHYGNPSEIGTDGHDDPPTWDERFNPIGIDRTQQENITTYPGGVKAKHEANLGISMAWWDPISQDSEHTDGKVADQTIELIKAHKDKPFLIAAGFYNPHCPYVAPKKYFDLYPLEFIKIQALESSKKDLEDVPAMAVQRDVGKNWPFYKKTTIDEARKCKQAYYACISFVDAQVGRILDALKEHNLMENTMIVFWSDHGYFLGEKGLWFKRKNFERSTRAPMIIAVPNQSQAGVARYQPVEAVDLFPTIADYAGFPIHKVDGVSLRPLLEDANAAWNKPAITQVYHKEDAQGYSIRVPNWRYTEWNGGEAGRELYDQVNDPDEVINLANDPNYAKVVADLSEKIRPFTKYVVTNKAK